MILFDFFAAVLLVSAAWESRKAVDDPSGRSDWRGYLFMMLIEIYLLGTSLYAICAHR